MKPQIFFLIPLLALTLGACQKDARLHVKKITVTDKTPGWNITVSHSVFSFTEPETEKACTAFNDEITGLTDGIRAIFIEHAREQIDALAAADLHPSAPYELCITDSVFHADDRYISVLVQAYQILGGANGNTEYYALNYDLRQQAFLTPAQLLDTTQTHLLNPQLRKHLNDPDGCYTFEAPTLDNCAAVNFTPDALLFTYAKYTLGPGACGPATIAIPRDHLAQILKIQ